MDETRYTLRELSKIMGLSKQALFLRAKDENWPAIVEKGLGGTHFEYAESALPEDIRAEIECRNDLKRFWAEQRQITQEAKTRALKAFNAWECRVKRFPIVLGIVNFIMALLNLGLLCMILNRIGR